LLSSARYFSTESRLDVEFDVCGDGLALEDLRRVAVEAGIADRFRCHGHCDRFKVRRMYDQSHVVVVPTRMDSGEGFNKVTVEAILCGRPVITSSAWTAWKPIVADAVMEVAPNDVYAYTVAITRLYEDRELYEQKSRACLAVQGQFYDPDRSWGAALRRVLTAVQDGRRPEPYCVPRSTRHGDEIAPR